ncbi:unnamed protein product [Amoebophrya sp. A120]|nr:unnamed protein product [Amoebophrya sp. A120]|eukprot:GSA120T00004320001.1
MSTASTRTSSIENAAGSQQLINTPKLFSTTGNVGKSDTAPSSRKLFLLKDHEDDLEQLRLAPKGRTSGTGNTNNGHEEFANPNRKSGSGGNYALAQPQLPAYVPSNSPHLNYPYSSTASPSLYKLSGSTPGGLLASPPHHQLLRADKSAALPRTSSQRVSHIVDDSSIMAACLQGVLHWWGRACCLGFEPPVVAIKRKSSSSQLYSAGSANAAGAGAQAQPVQQSPGLFPHSSFSFGFPGGGVLSSQGGQLQPSSGGFATAHDHSDFERMPSRELTRSHSSAGFHTCESEANRSASDRDQGWRRHRSAAGGPGVPNGTAAATGSSYGNYRQNPQLPGSVSSTPQGTLTAGAGKISSTNSATHSKFRRTPASYQKNLETQTYEQRDDRDNLMFERLEKLFAREFAPKHGGFRLDESLIWQFVFGYRKERDRSQVTERCFRMAMQERSKLGLLSTASSSSATPSPSMKRDQNNPNSGKARISENTAEFFAASGQEDLARLTHAHSAPPGGAGTTASQQKAAVASTALIPPPFTYAVAHLSARERQWLDYEVLHLGYETFYGYPVLWHLLDFSAIDEVGSERMLEPMLQMEYCVTENIRRLNGTLVEKMRTNHAILEDEQEKTTNRNQEPSATSSSAAQEDRDTTSVLQYKNVIVLDMAWTLKSQKNLQRKIQFFAEFVKRYEYFSPDSAYKILLINSPFIFQMIWGAISVFLSPTTKNKVKIFGKDYAKKLKAEGLSDENILYSSGGYRRVTGIQKFGLEGRGVDLCKKSVRVVGSSSSNLLL